jgi:formylglycine-generating enzyme required for sulfatase activity
VVVAGPPGRLVNSIGMELALVPAGSFRMGSPETEYASERSANGPAGADERPQHLVAVTSPFYLGLYPVTQRQYTQVMGTNPAEFNDNNRGGPDHPVERVSWADAQRFCERLSSLPEEREAGRLYRLPTEAEWEYACRAGTGTPFWWGDSASSHQANFDGSFPYGAAPRGLYLGRTTRVGSYPVNAFGLYDVHGNVWEWCEDYYEPRYYDHSPSHDPLGPTKGNRKCARGGSWSNSAADCRSACRDYWYGVDYARNNIGFRVAMTVSR